MHIAIAGNIGSGKTTLTKMLARHYGYRPIYESTETNPYINSFYEDMRRWSFNIQIYYLHTRTRQLLEAQKESENIIQDRTLYEDAYIFTPNLHAMGLMNTRDFDNYQHTFELVSSFLQPPDLLIYLRADVPTLIRNIQSRGREYENSIRLDHHTWGQTPCYRYVLCHRQECLPYAVGEAPQMLSAAGTGCGGLKADY